ncbi:MAG: DUF4221 family protein [Bacteroidota bacterium]
MKKINFILIPIILFLFSCNNEKWNSSQIINLSTNKIKIKTDSLGLSNYNVFSHYIQHDNLYFIGYNDILHCLEIYNITNEKFINRIKLNSDGPKSIGKIAGLYYHNKDSIFTFSRGKITLFDTDYTHFHYFDLFNIAKKQKQEFEPSINQHFRLIYDTGSKSIPLQNIFYSDKKSYYSDKNLISQFNIKEKKIEEIPFKHTENFDYVDEFGHLNYTTFSNFKEGEILVNQVYSPKTIKINLVNNDKETIINSNKDDFYSNQDLNNWQNHAIKSTYYNQLMKLDNNKFIRILWGGIEPESSKNGFLEKPLTVQLFDNNMSLLKEIELAENTYGVYSWFINQGDLFIQSSHPLYENLKENYFEIHRISFE